MSTLQLTNRKGTKDPISIFWVGEFGHYIMFVVPHINALRKLHPDREIVVASYEGDHIYLRDNKGEWAVDKFIGFPWWPTGRGCHECRDGLSAEAQEALGQLTGVILPTHKFSLAEYSKIFKATHRIAYPFKDVIPFEPKIGNGEHCVIFSRARNFGHEQRSWTQEKWTEFMGLLKQEHKGKIFICGVADQSMHFEDDDQIINVLDGEERSTITLNLLSNAKYCIADCSGSANYAILVGTPTFVSGPEGFRRTFTDTVKGRNYFGTYVHYQSIDFQALSAQERMDGFREFLQNYTAELQKTEYEWKAGDA